MVRTLLSPGMIALHFLAIAAVSTAGWLGFWQYDAWDARRDAQASELADASPVDLLDVMSADDPYPSDAVGRPVRFEGVWLGDETFFVADRELDGETGYWVVNPVAVCAPDCEEQNPAMLVVRGWTSSPDNELPAQSGTSTIEGWLQPPEGSGRQDPDPKDDVLAELRIADAIQRVDQDLFGAYVIANAGSGTANGETTTGETDGATDGGGAGLKPVTPDSLPEPTTFTAWRNLLYAVEWWVFGAFAVFVWWRWCRDQVEAHRSAEEAPIPEVASRP